jgi:two-component system, chemotaxis family, sensor kinase CheA
VIDKYRQAFQEEARELLTELESALLELNRDHGDRETVGRAFRALHTIKGSGAMFGFDAISSFAHGLETAFDRLRSGELEATPGLINLALAAADQIHVMLDEAEGRGAADGARADKILAELRLSAGAGERQPAGAPAPEPSPEAAPAGAASEWRIHFRPAPGALLNGVNPLLLLRELGALGGLRVGVDTDAIPALAEIDPERCYLAWDLLLTTAAGLDAIRDVFIFVEGDCDLTIEPVPQAAAEAEAAAPASAPGAAAEPAKPSARSAPPASGAGSSIRVPAERLDALVNLVGELVTVQARLSAVAVSRGDPEIQAVSEEIERLTASLRDHSMTVRMTPLRTTFDRFRRLVHDLGAELNKQVELTVEGADTELDKTVIDRLNDPLVHLIRNSMDHGIETAEARRAAGKPLVARIRLSAMHSGAHVLIRVSDDGRGLDAAAVRARAIERRLVGADAQLSESEILSLILAPGFSTAREVTDISGRGVGMDVVRRSVESLRGSVEVSSSQGEGMTVTLRLPLTLAIIDGLLIRVADTNFILPLANSLECVELAGNEIRSTPGSRLASVRGQVVPYIRLREFFGMEAAGEEREQIMVVETEHGRYGFVVDQVLGNHQTVIKNLGKFYRNVQAVSGATILGNGTVAPILDPDRLVQNAIQSRCEDGLAKGRDGRGGRA